MTAKLDIMELYEGWRTGRYKTGGSEYLDLIDPRHLGELWTMLKVECEKQTNVNRLWLFEISSDGRLVLWYTTYNGHKEWVSDGVPMNPNISLLWGLGQLKMFVEEAKK